MKFNKGKKVLILSLFSIFLFALVVFMNVDVNSNLATNTSYQQIDENNDKFDLKPADPYTDITVEEAYNMINDDISYPDLIVLDVRTQGEYDSYHICNAILIPHTELEARISELDPYKDTEIIVYCGSGVRSVIACDILESYDFTKVFNMLGGIAAWISEGYELCTPDDLDPPVWTEAPTDQLLEFGGSFNYDLDASDPSGTDEWWLNDTTHFDIDGNGLITNSGPVPIGEYWLEVNVNDTYGNTLTDTFKITVQDTISPSWVIAPSDKIIEFGDGLNYDLDATDLSGIDDWGLNDTTYFDIDGNGVITNITSINVGIYWLEVNVNDTFGNTLMDIFKVTVQDTTSPSWVQVPSDKIIEFGDGLNYDLNATDLSGIDEWRLNDTTYFDIDGNGVITNITSINVGIYWLEVNVNDTFGNILTETFKIAIEDTIAPTWDEMPTDQLFEFGEAFNYDLNASDASGIDHWWLNDTTYFDIDGNGVITNKSLVPIGEYWLEVYINDTYSNTLMDNFKIAVQDTTSPSWVLFPSDKIMELGDTFYYDLNATDLSGIGSWELNDTTNFAIDGDGIITNKSLVPTGVYWLEVIVEDIYSNTLIGSFKITIEDTTPPSWAPEPTDQYIDFGDGLNYDLDATDLSGIGSWELNDTTYFNIDSNGVITNITIINVRTYSLEVRVNDTCDNQRKITIRIIVQDIDTPIWIQVPSNKNMEAGTIFIYDLNASDASGIDDWWLNDTTYFDIDDATGAITNISQVPVGIYWLEVRAYDPYFQYCSAELRITVDDTIAPTWDEIPIDQLIEYGEAFNYDLNASDVSGIDDWWLNNTLNFEINGNGVITNNGLVPIGVYWLEIAAYDPSNHNCSATIKITVEDTIAPTWDEIPTDQPLEYGEAFNYDLNASDASGIDHWWLNDSTYFDIDDLTGMIMNIGQVPIGIYWLEARACDPSNQNCSANIKITVQDTTDPRWIELPIDQNIKLGDELYYDLNASDASGIDHWWLNDTTIFAIDAITGVITNTIFLEEGVYWLEVRAYDTHGRYCSSFFKIAVVAPTMPQDNSWWKIIIGSSVGIAAITIITIVIIKKRRT